MVKHTKKKKDLQDTFTDYIEDQNAEDLIQSDEGSQSSDHENAHPQTKILTIKQARATSKKAKSSINSARKLLKLFKGACHISEETQVDYDSPETLNYILKSSIKIFPRIFVKVFKDKSQKESLKTSYKNLFRSFLSNTLVLLKQVRDRELLAGIFKGLGKVMKYLRYFEEYIKNYVKISVKIWGEMDKTGKLLSYGFIRKIMVKNLYDKVEIMRLLYLNYAKNSKFMTWINYVDIETMRKCFIDILGTDLSAGYQIVFTSLRQQSIYLAQVVKNPSIDRIKTIYNWQFLNSLMILGQSISAYKDMSALAHPLIQIVSGVLSLTNIPKYFPLKLHLVRILIALQNQRKNYIPSIAPNVIEILTSPSLNKSVSTKKLKEFSFVVAIKTSKEQLASQLYREQLIDECCECLIEHFASISNVVAFPECFLPVSLTLKKHVKGVKNSVFREKIGHCLKVVQENSDWVEGQRKGIRMVDEKHVVDGEAPIREKCSKILMRRLEIVNSRINT
ncbi:hypothetical protein SteCoe_14933 [Stentor coeruleus]|uniref:Nucleolar complex protein 2 n=1 Tax=Stentor coeruleus TaxID=5963 RepID=A0A1R2C4V5_9CILI|nr:hypothetical protein SteCoe_14933 [Stentor coeruleus]